MSNLSNSSYVTWIDDTGNLLMRVLSTNRQRLPESTIALTSINIFDWLVFRDRFLHEYISFHDIFKYKREAISREQDRRGFRDRRGIDIFFSWLDLWTGVVETSVRSGRIMIFSVPRR